jgi:hypothetical protein
MSSKKLLQLLPLFSCDPLLLGVLPMAGRETRIGADFRKIGKKEKKKTRKAFV